MKPYIRKFTEDRDIAKPFQIVDHGVDHAQYFLGTYPRRDFDQAVHGAGSTPHEAVNDAIAQLYDVPDLEGQEEFISRIEESAEGEFPEGYDEVPSQISEIPEDEEQELHYYVTIAYNIPEEGSELGDN